MDKQLVSLAWDKKKGITITATRKQLRIRVWQTKKRKTANKDTAAGVPAVDNTQQVQEKKTSKHLYLVLDDWDKGYSIRKLKLNDDDIQEVVLRLEASNGSRDSRFVGVGSKILALWQPRSVPTRATVYDVDTGAVMPDGPLLPPDLRHVETAVVGGRVVYALHAGGLHSLEEEEPDYDDRFQPRWSWSRVAPLRLPFSCCFVHNENGEPVEMEIASYAVHPHNGNIFLSVRFYCGCYRTATFSLDTTAGREREWRLVGDWLLPFFGQGHYDATLGSWVGFHSPGNLCACQVPPITAGSEPLLLQWQLIEAKDMFVTNPEPNFLRGESQMTLACMGDAQFCILEPLSTGGYDVSYDKDHVGCKYVLRLTKFRLRRDRRGQLRPSSRRLTRSYTLRKHDALFAPRAFHI